MAVGIGEGAVVALLHRRREYPDGTRGGLPQTVPFIGYEKERLVLAVIQLRYKDRSAGRSSELVTHQVGWFRKEVGPGARHADATVTCSFEKRAVQLVGAGFRADNERSRPIHLGRGIVGLGPELRDCV